MTIQPTAKKRAFVRLGFLGRASGAMALTLLLACACGSSESPTPKAPVGSATASPEVANPQGSTTQTMSSATTAASGGVATIEELGIRLTVDDSIRDLVVSEGVLDCCPSKVVVRLSTRTLMDGGPYCTPEQGPLGAIAKTMGRYPAEPAGDIDGELVKQFPGFYLAYFSAQATCSANAAFQSIQTEQLRAVKAALKTAELSE